MKEKFIKIIYLKADYIISVVNESEKGTDHGDENFTIPPDLFGISKPFISIEMPYGELSETKSNHFSKKFHKFTNDGFSVVTRNNLEIYNLYFL